MKGLLVLYGQSSHTVTQTSLQLYPPWALLYIIIYIIIISSIYHSLNTYGIWERLSRCIIYGRSSNWSLNGQNLRMHAMSCVSPRSKALLTSLRRQHAGAWSASAVTILGRTFESLLYISSNFLPDALMGSLLHTSQGLSSRDLCQVPTENAQLDKHMYREVHDVFGTSLYLSS